MYADNKDTQQTIDDMNADEMSEAEIDDNLEDSFPASDPPSWTLGTDSHHSPERGNTKREDEAEINEHAGRRT